MEVGQVVRAIIASLSFAMLLWCLSCSVDDLERTSAWSNRSFFLHAGVRTKSCGHTGVGNKKRILQHLEY